MAIKEKLNMLRVAKGLSVAELAEVSGVSPPYIWQIEKGMKKNPSGEVLKRLATALGSTVAELLETSLAIPKEALAEVPPSLRRLARRKARQLDLREEDIEMLKGIHFRGRQPDKEEDWELIFLFLKRILG
jgi:transcriptional regulator with XRE-family HTH domain